MLFFFSFSGTRTVARKDTTTLPYVTVRHSQCELLLSSDESANRCHQCTRYRNTLRAIASRKRNQDVSSCSEGGEILQEGLQGDEVASPDD